MSIKSGDWTVNYNGKDAQGNFLADGTYVLEVDSSQGGSSAVFRTSFTVLSQAKPPLTGLLGPNPVNAGSNFVMVTWQPAQAAEVMIYDSTGSLIRSFVAGPPPPLTWDLKTASGHSVGAGVYLLVIRLPGQRSGKVLKLAIIR